MEFGNDDVWQQYCGNTGLIREKLLPELAANMEKRGWPFCPYVNPYKEILDDGIEDFLEVPRFSTGYAALNHTIGFMPETHMLKPYADRYESMRALMQEVLQLTVAHAAEIQAMRAAVRNQAGSQKNWPVSWKIDRSKFSHFKFKGFAAVYSPSKLGNYLRLSYDRKQPREEEPALRSEFEQWKTANPHSGSNQHAVLSFIYQRCQRYREPEWRRYPVCRIV